MRYFSMPNAVFITIATVFLDTLFILLVLAVCGRLAGWSDPAAPSSDCSRCGKSCGCCPDGVPALVYARHPALANVAAEPLISSWR